MGTAITWIIAFFIVITTAFSAITGVMTSGSDRAEAQADSNALLITDLESSFKLISVRQSTGHTLIHLILTNDGRRSFDALEDWVITVRYDQAQSPGETYLVPFYTDTLVNNSWTPFEFWIDYDADEAELLEPGILNVHEEMEIRIQVDPKLEHNTPVVVTLTSPQGVTESITFDA